MLWRRRAGAPSEAYTCLLNQTERPVGIQCCEVLCGRRRSSGGGRSRSAGKCGTRVEREPILGCFRCSTLGAPLTSRARGESCMGVQYDATHVSLSQCSTEGGCTCKLVACGRARHAACRHSTSPRSTPDPNQKLCSRKRDEVGTRTLHGAWGGLWASERRPSRVHCSPRVGR